MKFYTLIIAMAFFSLSACKKQKDSFPFQESGYAIAPIDSLINETYQVRKIALPDDYSGPVEATLLNKNAADTITQAVLYVHGYGDYFFHDHMRQWFNEQGYNFYALELRKYGRSLLPHQRPSYAKKMTEYYPEISQALEMIEADGNDFIVLNGHSTGGLITALYTNEGDAKEKIDALLLNSPFFDFRASYWERVALKTFAAWSRVNSGTTLPIDSEGIYGQSIHKDYSGEWDYNFVWKPIKGYPTYAAWIRAIRKGQKRLQKGFDIPQPILVLRSDNSYIGTELNDGTMNGDAVLDVVHMEQYGKTLGENVTIESIENGMHDIFLSNPKARAEAFEKVKKWLEDLHTH